MARTSRKPKQIVRDVESALNAYLQRRIDHRVISVVMMGEEGGASPAPVAAPQPSRGAPVAEFSAPRRVRDLEPSARGLSGVEAPGARPPSERVRFVSANLFVAGLRTQAQVELSWRGVTRLGSATGASASDSAERLVAAATLQALQPFLGEDRALSAQDVTRVRLGRRSVIVVAVKLLEQRVEKMLTGSCTVTHDIPQSVVYATLSAVNRVLGGLPVREPVEYELRPASA